jgi:hypothetical protein
MQILYIIVGVLGAWVVILTVLVVLNRIYFVKLGRDVGKDNLIKFLGTLVEIEKNNSQAVEDIKKEIAKIEERDKFHIQKIGLIKFNPFEEVGGEHSFSICLLNDNDSGIVLTGLHTRDRTRVYLKEVKKGKPQVELSKEESKSLRSAVGDD